MSTSVRSVWPIGGRPGGRLRERGLEPWPGWEGLLLDAYGIEPDPDRIDYYRLLWELGP
jgi:hypothetical protein